MHQPTLDMKSQLLKLILLITLLAGIQSKFNVNFMPSFKMEVSIYTTS